MVLISRRLSSYYHEVCVSDGLNQSTINESQSDLVKLLTTVVALFHSSYESERVIEAN
jgi:hypothetical protein